MKILRQQFLEHVAQTSPEPLAIEVERASGVFLYTPEGQRYFDLISGVSVSNVGHGNAAVVRAVCDQAAAYMHTMVYGEMVEAPQVRYAARLAGLLAKRSGAESGSGLRAPELQSVYFVNSGAEVIEGALKLAKRATGRRQMVAFRNAYHGSTHGALSMMSSPEGDEWRAPFEPLLPEVEWLTFNDFEGLGAISPAMACVLVEPVQGEAGVRLPAGGAWGRAAAGGVAGETGESFLAALRRRCDEVGALLIFDEIQTGMGRCASRAGELFAFQRYGVVPDILCVAKAFGGGMPLGAFIASRELMGMLSHDPALGHITTFGGHPVCCAAGLAALEVLLGSAESETGGQSLLAGVEAKGAMFEELIGGHPCVREVRRAGLLMAVELAAGESTGAGGASGESASARLLRLMALFRERGILSDWFLFCDTAFRISPPLTISEAEIRESCRVIVRCLDDLLF